jgi:hypothetical protein
MIENPIAICPCEVFRSEWSTKPRSKTTQAKSQQRSGGGIQQCPWHSHASHALEIRKGKVQTHPKHKKDHTQLGQLLNGFKITHKAGGEGANGDACQQVTDDGGQPDAPGKQAADESNDQGQGNVDQQGQFVHGQISWETLYMRQWIVDKNGLDFSALP